LRRSFTAQINAILLSLIVEALPGARIFIGIVKNVESFSFSCEKARRPAGTRIIDPGYNCGCAFWRVADNQRRMKTPESFQIRRAHVEDVPIILQLIRDLATYERAPDEVTATEEQLIDVLFCERPAAEVLLAFEAE